MFKLSVISMSRLEGIDKKLAAVVHRAIEISSVDFMVIEGRRSEARQAELYAQGRTKPGKIVTWTLKSKHIDGLAVDLAPLVNGAVDWSDVDKFDQIATAMFAAGAELGIKLRWGANWDGDTKPHEKGEGDSPHFELAA